MYSRLARAQAEQAETEEKRFITMVNQMLVQIPRDSKPEQVWPKLLHERMIAQQDVVSEQQLDAYVQIFQQWFDMVPETAENKANRRLADAFLTFATTHQVDPCNTLVSMRPSESTLHALKEARNTSPFKVCSFSFGSAADGCLSDAKIAILLITCN